MSDSMPPSPSPSVDPASGGFSWVTELLQRVPAHSLMAGLFVYFILYIIPQKEAWYWGQLEKERTQFLAVRQAYEERKDEQIRNIEQLCYGAIQQDYSLSKNNEQRLIELHQLVTEQSDFVRQQCSPK